MMVTSSRKWAGQSERTFRNRPEYQERNLQRLRLLTWRRMQQLGLRTYREFSAASGISEGVIRRVLAPHGDKNVGPELAERWLAALELEPIDRAEVESWFGLIEPHLPNVLLDQSEAEHRLAIAIEKHERAEFNSDSRVTGLLYLEAAQDLREIAGGFDLCSAEQKLIKGQALYRLARIESLLNQPDRAYWHAEEAASLMAGMTDTDLFLLARRELALSSQQLGRSGWWEALKILGKVNEIGHSRNLHLGKQFPDQDPGLWTRLTHRDIANILLRQGYRSEASTAIAELRAAMRYRAEPLDEFLINITEARLKSRGGHTSSAIRILLNLYRNGMPQPGGPIHYQTLLTAMAEAQVRGNWKDPEGKNYLSEALKWAQVSGLAYQEGELRLQFRDQLNIL